MIAARGLTRGFAGRDVVRDLDFEAAPGDRLALAGPNGSGKTTILRCILGSLEPDAGSITVGGSPAGSLAARRRVGSALAHDRSLYLRLTGRQNLLLFARLRGLAETDVAGVVDELGLAAFVDKRADRLSTGQQQQVAFARALLGNPAVLLLDEPTRSLDEGARGALWAALDRRATTAVVLATHLEEDLRRCPRVLRLPGENGP
jgi:ABC-type multidrug transport system ATPase subunit